MTFYPDPTETVNLLIAAVNANDYLELEERSADLSWSMPEDDFDKRIQEAFNSVIVFEILEEPIIKGNIAQVKIKFTFPDFKSLIEDLMVDVEFWALYLKPILLGAIEGKEYEELQLVSDQILSDEFIARIKNPSAKSVAEETLMELEFDEETESWLLSSWNYESMIDFSDIEEPEMPEDMLIQAGTRALEMLYADGEISKSEYNSLLKGLQE